MSCALYILKTQALLSILKWEYLFWELTKLKVKGTLCSRTFEFTDFRFVQPWILYMIHSNCLVFQSLLSTCHNYAIKSQPCLLIIFSELYWFCLIFVLFYLKCLHCEYSSVCDGPPGNLALKKQKINVLVKLT